MGYANRENGYVSCGAVQTVRAVRLSAAVLLSGTRRKGTQVAPGAVDLRAERVDAAGQIAWLHLRHVVAVEAQLVVRVLPPYVQAALRRHERGVVMARRHLLHCHAVDGGGAQPHVHALGLVAAHSPHTPSS
jgi:hypothetical protein